MSVYILQDDQQTGPFEPTALAARVARGDLSGETLAWRDGMDDWTPVNLLLEQEIDAARYGTTTLPPRPKSAPPAPRPEITRAVLQQAQQTANRVQSPVGTIRKKSEFMGVGALVQLFGIVAMVIVPWIVGVPIGVLFLLIGSRMAIKFQCSLCGTKLADKSVTICPGCRCRLTRK